MLVLLLFWRFHLITELPLLSLVILRKQVIKVIIYLCFFFFSLWLMQDWTRNSILDEFIAMCYKESLKLEIGFISFMWYSALQRVVDRFCRFSTNLPDWMGIGMRIKTLLRHGRHEDRLRRTFLRALLLSFPPISRRLLLLHLFLLPFPIPASN